MLPRQHRFCYCSVNNGTPPYSYAWKGPGAFASTNDAIYELGAGMYVLTVTDANGCAVTDSIEITEPEELLAEISADVLESCPADTIHLTSTVTGGTGAYSHKWTGDGAAYLNYIDVANPVFRGAPAGSYELIYTVTDANNCTARDEIDIHINPPFRDTIPMTVCVNDLPVNWGGQEIKTPGIYTDSLSSVNGCDSILVLNFNLFPEFRDTIPMADCIGKLPFDWYGQQVNGAGYYEHTLAICQWL